MRSLYRHLSLLAVIWTLFTSTAQAQGVVIHDAWIRGVPAASKSTAAFMTIENTGTGELVLESAACEVAGHVQIHTLELDGDVMKMKELSELRIPGKGQADLAPKGHHLMLIGLFRPLILGETVPLTLNFADGAAVRVNAVVRKWESMAPIQHN